MSKWPWWAVYSFHKFSTYWSINLSLDWFIYLSIYPNNKQLTFEKVLYFSEKIFFCTDLTGNLIKNTLFTHFHHMWKWKLWQLRKECQSVGLLLCDMTLLLVRILYQTTAAFLFYFSFFSPLNLLSVSRTTFFIITGSFLLFGFVLQQDSKFLQETL